MQSRRVARESYTFVDVDFHDKSDCSLLLVSLGKRLGGQDLDFEDSSPPTIIATGIRMTFTLTIGIFSWEIDDLASVYNATCDINTTTADQTGCEGIRATTPSLEKQNKVALVRRTELSFGELNNFTHQMQTAFCDYAITEPYFAWKKIISVDNPPPSILFPRNFEVVTNSTTTYLPSISKDNCDYFTDMLIKNVMTNHLYAEESLQMPYTAAFHYVMQNGVLPTKSFGGLSMSWVVPTASMCRCRFLTSTPQPLFAVVEWLPVQTLLSTSRGFKRHRNEQQTSTLPDSKAFATSYFALFACIRHYQHPRIHIIPVCLFSIAFLPFLAEQQVPPTVYLVISPTYGGWSPRHSTGLICSIECTHSFAQSFLNASHDLLILREPRDVSRVNQAGRVLHSLLHDSLDICGRDLVDLGAHRLGRLPLAVREQLTTDVFVQDHAGLEVHEHRRLELVLGTRELDGVDGSVGHAQHLVAQQRHEVAGVRREARAVDAEQTHVRVDGREGEGRLDPVEAVQHARVQPRVHALAGPARREAVTAAQQRVEHADRNQVLVVPATGGEGQRRVRELGLRVRARGRRHGRARWGHGDVGEELLRVLDQPRVVDARAGQHHLLRHEVLGAKLLDLVHRERVDLVERTLQRPAQRRVGAVGGRVDELLQHGRRVLHQVLGLDAHDGFDALHLVGHEVHVEDGVGQQLQALLHVVAQQVDRVDDLLAAARGRRERADVLDLVHQLRVRARRGALEAQVLQQVAHAHALVVLEAAAGVDEDAERGGLAISV
ncbi:hypothetical protein ON010_g15119 [Phytophthora cinnamomi]|nr:hypothetical protein ON010_g15119 [Phytophthora cinnamomi]